MAECLLPCFPGSAAEMEAAGGRAWGQGLGARLRKWVLADEAGCSGLPTLSSPSGSHRSLPTKPRCRQSEPRFSTLRVDGAGKGGTC